VLERKRVKKTEKARQMKPPKKPQRHGAVQVGLKHGAGMQKGGGNAERRRCCFAQSYEKRTYETKGKSAQNKKMVEQGVKPPPIKKWLPSGGQGPPEGTTAETTGQKPGLGT